MAEPVRNPSWDHWIARRGGALAAAVIVLVAVAVYANSLSNPFVLDDEVVLKQNPTIRPPWTLRSLLHPPEDSTLAGRPVANLTFALNYAMGGASPWGYHAGNILIHALVGLTLFGIVRRSFARAFSPAGGAASTTPTELAFAIALLWVAHPLATSTIGYVSQRTESLMGLCYLLTLYFFLRGAEGSARVWLPLSVAACGLGMAVKEVMVTAPIAILLCDVALVAGTLREAWRHRWGYYLALGATWLLLAGFMSSHLELRGVGFSLGVTPWVYALTECRALVLYLQLAVWPHPLVFDYGPVFVRDAMAIAPQALLLALVLAGVLVAWFRWPRLALAGGWFFLVLAPTSSVVPITLQPIAESRVYLPLIAVVTLVTVGVWQACGRRGLAALLLLAAFFGVASAQRNQTYRTARALWADTVAKRPENPRAQTNLGAALFREGDRSAAMIRHALALRLDPRHAPAQNNYGYQALLLGRTDVAIAHLQEAVRLTPAFVEARNNLAAALNLAGRFAEALQQGEIALRAAPLLPEVHYNVGNSLLALGRPAEAVVRYEAELRREPDHAGSLHNLGRAFLQLGRTADAVRALEHAVRVDPAFAEAHGDLGFALAQVGRTDAAVAQLTECLRLDPNNAAARNNLAALRRAPSPARPDSGGRNP